MVDEIKQKVSFELDQQSLNKALGQAKAQILQTLKDTKFTNPKTGRQKGFGENPASQLNRNLQNVTNVAAFPKEFTNTMKQAVLLATSFNAQMNKAAASVREMNKWTSETYTKIQAASKDLGDEARLQRVGKAMRQNYEIENASKLQIKESQRLKLELLKLEKESNVLAAKGLLTDKEKAKVAEQQARLQQQIVDARKAERPVTQPKNPLDRDLGPENMAKLLKIQTAIRANYMAQNLVLNSVSNAGQFVVDLDKNLKQLQAVGALTDTQMGKLSESLIDVSKNSKFSAVEVSEAAVVLAQAGMGMSDIQESMQSIIQLAQGAGVTLTEAVSTTTSVLNVFNLQASQTSSVANILTAALNESKLGMQQLSLGIQYGANIAADSNIRFTEMVATFGVLADAGIRSGSTIGTGYTQLINDLKNPSEKLQERLVQLGINFNDVDVNALGLTETLKRLEAGGFTSADALETMELRAGRTFSALQRGTRDVGEYEQKLRLSEAAAQASAVQMTSLSAAGEKLGNSLGVTVYNTLEALIPLMTGFLGGVTKLVQVFDTLVPDVVKAGGALLIFTPIIAAVVTHTFGLWRSLKLTQMAIVGFTTVSTLLRAEAGALAVSFSTLQLSLGAVGVVLAGLTYAYYQFNESSEVLQTKIKDNASEIDKLNGRITQAEEFMHRLQTQQEVLRKDTTAMNTTILEAQNAFGNLGMSVVDTADKFDTLLVRIREVRDLDLAKLSIKLGNAVALTGKEALTTREEYLTAAQQTQEQLGYIQNTTGDKPRNAFFKDLYQSEPKTKEEADKFLSNFSRLITQYEKLNPTDTEFLDKAYALAADLSKKSNAYELSRLTASENVRNKANTDQLIAYQASPAAKVFETRLEKFAQTIKDYGSNATSTQAQMILDQRKALMDDAEKIGGAIGAAQLKQINNLDVQKRIPAILKLRDTELAQNADTRLQNAEAGYKSTSSKLSMAPRSEVPNLMQDLKGFREEIVKAKLAIYDQSTEAKEYRKTLADVGMNITQQDAKMAEARQQKAEAINAELDAKFETTSNNVTKRLDKFGYDTTRSLGTTVDQIINSFKELDGALQAQRDAAYLKADQLNARLEAMDMFSNRNKVPFFARNQVQRELEQAQIEGMKNEAVVIEEQQKNRLAAIAQLSAEIKRLEAQAGMSASEALNGAGLGSGRRAGGARNDAIEQLRKAQGDLVGIRTEAAKGAVELAGMNIKLKELNTTYENMSGFQVAIESFKDWSTLTQDQLSGNAALAESFKEAFDNISGSAKNMAKEILKGNETIGGSFKGLANVILDQMLNIALARVSSGFMSILGDIGMSLIGSLGKGTQMYSSPIGPQQPFMPAVSLKRMNGGPIPHMAAGGQVRGNYVPGRDTIPTMLQPGEYVLRRKAVQKIGMSTVAAMNETGQAPLAALAANNNNAGTGTVNVYVVQPEAMPALGPKDVIAVVGQDLSSRGPLSKLVKSVTMGGAS